LLLKPGDRLNTHCVFNSMARTSPTRMGTPSTTEMCMDFINYYPRLKYLDTDYAYCGYFALGTTFCGGMSVVGTVHAIPNPIRSDLEEGLNRTFGLPCNG